SLIPRLVRLPARSTLCPSPTLFRSRLAGGDESARDVLDLLRAADRRSAELHHDQLAVGRGALTGGVGRELRDALEVGARHAKSRSEEHTSELQSQLNLVCRLLFEKK